MRTKTVTYTAVRLQMDPGTVAENVAVVRAATEALGRLGDPDALWPLMDLAEERLEPQLALPAAAAVGAIGTDAARRFLADLAAEEEPLRRVAAAGGLGAFRGGGAADSLWPLARDEAEEVRRSAVEALIRRPLAEILPGLRTALLSADGALRERAVSVAEGQAARGEAPEDEFAALLAWLSAQEPAPGRAEVREGLAGALERSRAVALARARSETPASPAPSRAAPAPAPLPPVALAAETAPDGVPIYRPVRHRVLPEGDGGAALPRRP